MQEMKASKYPTKHNHPKHYTVILKIMLLAQEAKHSRKKRKEKKLQYIEKINIFNIHSMDCVVLTAKVTKLTKTGFVSLWCLLHVSPSFFSFVRLRQYKGL